MSTQVQQISSSPGADSPLRKTAAAAAATLGDYFGEMTIGKRPSWKEKEEEKEDAFSLGATETGRRDLRVTEAADSGADGSKGDIFITIPSPLPCKN